MTIRTLDDIRTKKNSINQQLIGNKQEIGDLWDDLVRGNPPSTRGEMIANFAGNAWAIVDGFLLVRKLLNLRSRRRRRRFF